jgi:gamma-glutamyltranspeptidase/glutathione hydrolase
MTFTPPPAFTTRPTLEGHFGMAASTHWLATATSQAVLERGGNAFDAAVAGAFVLHVVEPHLNGPGGDMTGIFATDAEPSRPQVMMGQGPAPAAATIEHFRGEGLDMVPGSGALAAAVPGAVDSWLNLLEHHGTWELADVLDFAIDYADNGHPILARAAGTIAKVSELFTDHWPTSVAQWMPEGRVAEAGELVFNHAYADVLRRLIAAGEGAAAREERIRAARQEWKSGFVARAIADFITTAHRHSTGGDHAGVMTLEDISAFDAGFEDPVTIDFRGYQVAKIGAWGQGPVLLQTLKILEGFDDDRLDPSTEVGAHTILEALKLAMADRDTYYGDADVDLDWLLSDSYAAFPTRAHHRAGIGGIPSRAWPGWGGAGLHYSAHSRRCGQGSAHQGGYRGADRAEERHQQRRHLPPRRRRSVGQYDLGDPVRRVAAVLADRSRARVLPRHPAADDVARRGGSLGSASGQASAHDIDPDADLEDGQPVIALGSPGGDQQEQWQLLLILRMLVGGYRAQEAIDAPALHTTSLAGSFWPRTWVPGGAVVEDRLGEDVINGLINRGHDVTRAGEWELGRLSCVTRDPATGRLSAGANPRGAQGYAAGR